jgi:hypothetical protein
VEGVKSGMSYFHLCSQFSCIVHTQESTYGGLDVLVVQEEFLSDQWVTKTTSHGTLPLLMIFDRGNPGKRK